MISLPSRVGSLAPGRECFDTGSSSATSPLSTMSASRMPVKAFVIEPISKSACSSSATGAASFTQPNAKRVLSSTSATATHAGSSESAMRWSTVAASGSGAVSAFSAAPAANAQAARSARSGRLIAAVYGRRSDKP